MKQKHSREPTASQVRKSLDKILRYTSGRAQIDYKGKLNNLELRLVTTIYARRVIDLLDDRDVELYADGGELCLKK